MRPAMEHANVTPLTNARGHQARDERRRHRGHRGRRRARRADGARPRPTSWCRLRRRQHGGLLLVSANDRHPNGLANGSDQVGRNYMFHASRRCSRCRARRTRRSSRRRSGSTTSTSGRRRRVSARQHPDGRQVAGADVPRREAGRDEARAGRSLERSRTMRSTSGSRPRTCRARTTASPSTATGRSRSCTGDERRAEGPALREAQVAARPARHERGPPDPPVRLYEERHPGRRRRPPGRHRPLRRRPGRPRCSTRLPGARARQPLRRRHELLPEHRRGQPGADGDGDSLRVGDHLLERLGAGTGATARAEA